MIFLLFFKDIFVGVVESVAFSVQLLLQCEFVNYFGVHNVRVLFRDQSNDEVEKNDKEDDLIEEPKKVNQVDDNLT